MTLTRIFLIAAFIALGATLSLGTTTAYAGGWTNTGGLAWFK